MTSAKPKHLRTDAVEWSCDNYAPPTTCLTAPSSESGRCDHCRKEAETPVVSAKEEIARKVRSTPRTSDAFDGYGCNY